MATHAVMSSKLAKALIEAGVKHFDAGGSVAPPVAPSQDPSGMTVTSTPNWGAIGASAGAGAAVGSVVPGIGTAAGAVAGGMIAGSSALGAALTPQNQFTALGGNYIGNMNQAVANDFATQGQQQGLISQQQSLANQLLAESRGGGPNPAQSMYRQNVDQGIQATRGAIASTRGLSPAVAGRLAAESTGNQMQQASGQAATMQAQQQLLAQQQLAAQQQAIGGTENQVANENQALYGTSVTGQSDENKTNQLTSGENTAAVQKTTGGILNAAGSILGMAKGGKVPDHLAHIAKIYHPDFGKSAVNMKSGGPVPGKAKVQGNSLKNDVVPAMLSPGEEVLPRSVTQAPNAPQKAAEFVKALQDREEKKKAGPAKFQPSKRAAGTLKQRVERIEKMFMGGVA